MQSFEYVIKDELGIHARPAGVLVKEVKKYRSRVTIQKDGKEVEADRLMALMGMGIKKGDTITVKLEGPDEEEAAGELESFICSIL